MCRLHAQDTYTQYGHIFLELTATGDAFKLKKRKPTSVRIKKT